MATRNNTFILKRSNVVNKIPVLSGLTLGELALNTADAKLYTLYTGGLTGATEVREIGWNRLSISGGTLYGQTYYSFGTGWTQNQTVSYISAATGNVLVTKEWVESLSVDLSSSIAVNVATTSALPASTYNNGTNGVGATLTRNTSGTTGTIDGITVGLGDRILVKNQASQIQNGVYGVTVLGTGSTAFVLTRTTDSDTTVEFDPQIVIASRGTQAGLRFAQTTADPNIGVSNIVYTSVGSSFVTQSAAGTQTSGNIPFWTNVARDLSKGSNTQLFWDNVNKRLGVGIGSPTASLHIKGSGTTNATYSLKVEDGLNRNILSTRNDNFVVVGDAAVNSYLWVNGPSGQFGFTNESGNPYLYLNSNITNNKFFISNGGAGSNVFGQINTNNGNWLFSDPNSNANLAILTDTKVTINGADSSSTKYGLRVTQNNDPGVTNVTTDVFVVRNDSKVGVGTSNPTEKFEVSGKTKTITLQVTSGATAGYVLTALDSNGNAYWAPTFSGSSSVDTFTTGFTYSNNNLTILQNQGQSPLSVNISVMTGLTIAGNLTVTGNTSLKALTGTTALFSSSGPSVLTVIGSGSSTTLPIFTVQGSSGELFSVTDSLTGSLFSVNDISGLPILEVFSDNTILMGSYLAPSLNTTVRSTVNSGSTTLYSIPTSAYTGAFFEYTVNDGTNLRSGSIMSIWSGNTVNYTETSTTDIGNTNPITFNMISSSGFASLRTSATTNNWTVKTIVRSI